MNQVILSGHLGKAPELRVTPDGKSVANFSMATENSYNKDGERVEKEPTWHRVTVWGKVADNCGKFLTSGSHVLVVGRIENGEYVDKKTGETKYTHDIVAESVKFLDKKPRDGGGSKSLKEPAEEPSL